MIKIRIGDAVLYANITHYQEPDPSTGYHDWVEWELFDENGDRQVVAEQIVGGVRSLFDEVGEELRRKYLNKIEEE